jgi:methionine synthase / methylenetetrahydrofolate reductase(NADPH)
LRLGSLIGQSQEEYARRFIVKTFREKLQKEVIVFDGGVGTYLYEKGIYINTCFDELNLTNPDIVTEVHRDYVNAGADVIETNTFGANRFRLAPHGLEGKVYEISLKGAQLAKKAAQDKALVAGSVGPLGVQNVLRRSQGCVQGADKGVARRRR